MPYAQLCFINNFDRYVFSSKKMNRLFDFAKTTVSNGFQ